MQPPVIVEVPTGISISESHVNFCGVPAGKRYSLGGFSYFLYRSLSASSIRSLNGCTLANSVTDGFTKYSNKLLPRR